MTKEKKLKVITQELELYEKTLKNLQMCVHELREEIQEMLPKCEKVFHDKKVFKCYTLDTMFRAIDLFPYIEKDWKTINYTVWKNDFGSYTCNANGYIAKATSTVHKEIIATCIPSLKLVIIVER